MLAEYNCTSVPRYRRYTRLLSDYQQQAANITWTKQQPNNVSSRQLLLLVSFVSWHQSSPARSLNNAKQTIVKLFNIDPSKYGKLESEITVNINVKDFVVVLDAEKQHQLWSGERRKRGRKLGPVTVPAPGAGQHRATKFPLTQACYITSNQRRTWSQTNKARLPPVSQFTINSVTRFKLESHCQYY